MGESICRCATDPQKCVHALAFSMGGTQGGSAVPPTRPAAAPPWEGPVVNGGERLPHDAAQRFFTQTVITSPVSGLTAWAAACSAWSGVLERRRAFECLSL